MQTNCLSNDSLKEVYLFTGFTLATTSAINTACLDSLSHPSAQFYSMNIDHAVSKGYKAVSYPRNLMSVDDFTSIKSCYTYALTEITYITSGGWIRYTDTYHVFGNNSLG